MSRVPVVIWTTLRVVAAGLFLGWAALHLRLLDRVIGLGLPEWLKPAGMVLLLVGGVVVLLCGGMLSTPGMTPTKFVVLGPFRYVRNPMSLGGDHDVWVGALLSIHFRFALFCDSIPRSARTRGLLGRALFGEAVWRELSAIQALRKSLASDLPTSTRHQSFLILGG
jgi:hypothetical protein